MSKQKLQRNEELVLKRRSGWSFRKLAQHFNLTVSRTYEIWEDNNKKVKKGKK